MGKTNTTAPPPTVARETSSNKAGTGGRGGVSAIKSSADPKLVDPKPIDEDGDGPNILDDRQVLQVIRSPFTSALIISGAMAIDAELPHDVRGIGLYLCAKLHFLPDDAAGFDMKELRVPGTSPERVAKALDMLRARGHIDDQCSPILRCVEGV